jgi:hypothetical protein
MMSPRKPLVRRNSKVLIQIRFLVKKVNLLPKNKTKVIMLLIRFLDKSDDQK